MIQAISKIIIHQSADDIWRVISGFEAGCRYLHGVVDCVVEGKGIGALRTLVSANGDRIVERLVVLDDEQYRLSYALLSNTPFRDCVTTMAVHDVGPGMAQLDWSAVFEAEGLPEGEAAELLGSALALNCNMLKHFLEE